MTGALGIVLAITAGWLVSDRRRLALVIIPPFLVVLVIQTWHIASGRGVSPPSAVEGAGLISYSIVQLIILGLALGAADQIRLFRVRSGSRSSADATARRTSGALLINCALSGAVVAAFLLDRPVFDPGSVVHHSSEGNPPVLGILGIGLDALVLVVLGLLALRSRRARKAGAREVPADGAAADRVG